MGAEISKKPRVRTEEGEKVRDECFSADSEGEVTILHQNCLLPGVAMAHTLMLSSRGEKNEGVSLGAQSPLNMEGIWMVLGGLKGQRAQPGVR